MHSLACLMGHITARRPATTPTYVHVACMHRGFCNASKALITKLHCPVVIYSYA